MQSDTSSHAVLGKSVQNEPLKKIYLFFFDYWTVFSTLIQFIHELAPRSLWFVLGKTRYGTKASAFNPRFWDDSAYMNDPIAYIMRKACQP